MKGKNKITDKITDKIQEKVVGTTAGLMKKGTAAAGAKAGAALGRPETGGVAGAVAGVAVAGAMTQGASKEVVKATAGAITGATIQKGTQYAVTYTTKSAAAAAAATSAGAAVATTGAATVATTAGAAVATTAGTAVSQSAATAALKVSAAKGAASAATGAGGIMALFGEFVGGRLGERWARQGATTSRYRQEKVEEAAVLGKEFGAFSGATGAGAAAGGLVGGPAGALAGAGIGAASYGIGKVTTFAIDKAASYEGVVLVQPTLSTGSNTVDPEDAEVCIVTEEGIGKCKAYFYKTRDGAQKAFKKLWCARIMFEMEDGHLAVEMERGGFPWHQATILQAAKRLRGTTPPSTMDLSLCRWTDHGVESAKQAKVWEILGCPEAGSLLSQAQSETMRSNGTSTEQMVELGYLEQMQRIFYIWTAQGVQMVQDAKLWVALDKPAAISAITDEQVEVLSAGGLTLEQLVREGIAMPAAEQSLTAEA